MKAMRIVVSDDLGQPKLWVPAKFWLHFGLLYPRHCGVLLIMICIVICSGNNQRPLFGAIEFGGCRGKDTPLIHRTMASRISMATVAKQTPLCLDHQGLMLAANRSLLLLLCLPATMFDAQTTPQSSWQQRSAAQVRTQVA